MKKLLFIFFLFIQLASLHAQNSPDTLKKEPPKANADDPSQFFNKNRSLTMNCNAMTKMISF